MSERVTVNDVMAMAGCVRATVCAAIARGEMRAEMYGRTFVVDADSAREWAENFAHTHRNGRKGKRHVGEYVQASYHLPKELAEWIEQRGRDAGTSISQAAAELLTMVYDKEGK